MVIQPATHAIDITPDALFQHIYVSSSILLSVGSLLAKGLYRTVYGVY
jgi:hypothetical protein